jgi:hypothetical protein
MDQQYLDYESVEYPLSIYDDEMEFKERVDMPSQQPVPAPHTVPPAMRHSMSEASSSAPTGTSAKPTMYQKFTGRVERDYMSGKSWVENFYGEYRREILTVLILLGIFAVVYILNIYGVFDKFMTSKPAPALAPVTVAQPVIGTALRGATVETPEEVRALFR